MPELRARARTRLSHAARVLGDNVSAWQHAEEAHRLAGDLPVEDQVAALHALVSAEAEAGKLTDAAAHSAELRQLTADGPRTDHVSALWAYATVRVRQGDHTSALEAIETALDRLDSHDDLMLWMRLAAASLYLQVNPPLVEKAHRVLEEADPVVALVGTDLHRQQMHSIRARLSFAEGRLDDARALCADSDQGTDLLSFRDRMFFEALRGRLMIIDGDVEGGTAVLDGLAQQAQDSLNVELAAEIWRSLALTLAGTRANPPGDVGFKRAG